MPAPHSLFNVWRPDEVAECLDYGYGQGNADIYRALWKMVRHYEHKERSEVPDDFPDFCLANWWDELSEAHQEKLNAAAQKEFPD